MLIDHVGPRLDTAAQTKSRAARGGVRRRSSAAPRVGRAVGAAVDSLERRLMFVGTWTSLAHAAPGGVGTMLLLPDGTVMAEKSGVSNVWYKLTPDSTGSYTNGTWSTLASMSLQRLYFASQVLPNGNVFVLGGEYSGASGSSTWTNTGEMYNPVSNTWTAIASYPETQYGDVPSAVLPNGTILCGSLTDANTYIYNPANNTWTQAGTKLYSDRSDEENWIKLSDGSILSYDVFGNSPDAQRYIPSSNTWVPAGSATAQLQTSGGYELGPGFLLPSGQALQIGGNSNNSIYVPLSNSWVAAAATPSSYGANDAPAAMLPNGNVLVDVGDTSTSFNPPTYLYEYSPTSNTFTSVPTPVSLASIQPYITRMLMLPTGQVLFTTDSSTTLYAYNPTGSPSASWRPAVSNIVNNGNNTFTVSGTQLNGMSEGADYGDDAQMSSNYPIVKFTTSSGSVYFGRTSQWSSTWDQTGTNVVTTQVTLPSTLQPSAYLVSVSGAGISTANNVLDVQIGTATTSSITLRTDPNNSANTQVLAGTNALASFADTSFSSIIISGDNNNDTVDLKANLVSVPIVVNGGTGNDTVIVESPTALGNLSLNLGTGTGTLSLQANTFTVATNLGALGSGLNVTVASSATVSLTGAQTLASLTSTSGTSLTIGGAVSLGGSSSFAGVTTLAATGSIAGAGAVSFPSGSRLEWQGGTMTGTGVTTVGAGATVDFSASLNHVLSRELDSSGLANLSLGTLDVSTSAGTFKNLGGGTFNLGNTAAISYVGTAGTFSNAGTFNKTGGTSSVSVPFSNTGTINLSSGTYNNLSTLTQTSGKISIGAPSAYSGTPGLTIAGGSLVAGADLSGLSLTLLSGASATFAVSQHLASLSIASGAKAALASGGRSLTLGGLSDAGTLDLSDGLMVLNYASASPIGSVATELASGYASGAWAGTGIVSSAAAADASGLHSVGYAEASDILGLTGSETGTWQGQTVTATSVLAMYTYVGDTDLSGAVDGSDVANLQAGMSGGLSGWVNGDMNYDGSVTPADMSLLLAGLSGQGAPLGNSGSGGGSVPGAKGGAPQVAHVALVSSPGSTSAGQGLSKITVELEDAQGNVVRTDNSLVKVSILSGPANGRLIGVGAAYARAGVATFSGLSIQAAGNYTLRVTDGAYAAAVTPSFSVSAGPAARLAFASVPASVQSGYAFLTSVSVLDAYGNVVTDESGTASLSLFAKPGGSVPLLGGTTASVSDGVAYFPNLSLTNAGSYSFAASVGALRALSSQVRVS